MPKAPYGSAPKVVCEKCSKSFSRTNASKHVKRCQGMTVRCDRSEIRKKSWVKHRAKRVGAQRSKRAAALFKQLQGVETQGTEEGVFPPKPEPTGLQGHPLELLSRNAALFEYVFSQVEHKELLSVIWFRKVYMVLHPDRQRHMPPEFQGEQVKSLLYESCKMFSAFRDGILEPRSDVVLEERVRLQKYRKYLQTSYKRTMDKWEKICEAIRVQNEASSSSAASVQNAIDEFGEFKNCGTFAEYETKYLASYKEKDKLHEAKLKEKQDEEDKESRFRAAFGNDLTSDDE